MCALFSPGASAQTVTTYPEPALIYTFTYSQPFASPNIQTAYAAYANQVDGTSGNYTNTAQNLHVSTAPQLATTINGIPVNYSFDLKSCSTINGQCTTITDWGLITSVAVCENGTTPTTYNTSNHNTVEACPLQFTNIPPPYCKSKSCIGDPIHASNGELYQAETDYTGVGGLDYQRTYRSTNGYFASSVTRTFVNGALTGGTPTQQCYPGYWTYQSFSGAYCYPYINVSPYVNNGVPQYQLQTEDGFAFPFSGPATNVTQNADVNERATQITVNGNTEWQVARQDDSTEIYSSSGSLLQKTLRGGRTLTYTYSTTSTPSNIAPFPGLLLTQSDPFGHTLSWQYNSTGLVSQMTDPAGGVYQYGYDGSGNLTSVQYPDSTSKAYSYNEAADTNNHNFPNALTGITDESGVRYATFKYTSYSSAPFAISTQHAAGADTYTLTSYSPGYNATVSDPLGASRTYNVTSILSYSEDTNTVQPAASGSGNATKRWGHDANGNISQQTDFNGNITNYTYDLTRNLETSRTEAYGTSSARTITTTWDANWRQPDLITEPNRKTAFTYDSMGNVLTKTVTDTTVTPNVSRTWTYTYDGYGRMLTAKGPRTDLNSTMTYTYYTCTTGYQCGQLQTVTDPVGNVTTYNTYNAHGQPLTITDPNGVVTTLTYDARARLTSRQVGSETTSFSYYSTGLLKKVTLPDSSYVQYTYDNAHRLTQISDGAGNSIQYTLDAMGNRTAEKTYDPSSVLHRTHTRAYSALNTLYQDINAAGTSAVTTTYAYDNNANQTSVAAPLSRNTTNAYDPLNRLKQITDPNSGNTYFGYDAEDDLTSVKDPRSLTTSYSYNGFGDLTQQVSPDTGTTANTYDSGGNLATVTDARNAVASYAYDKANRVTSITYKYNGVADQTITFGYDSGTNGKGRLSSASDASHSLSWTYDGLGRVTGKGLTIGSVNKSVGYGYTNADLTSIVTPSNQSVTYGYNANHQITSIAVNGTTVISGVTYEPFGGINGWTWGNGSTVSRTYNGDGLVSQIVTAGVTLGYSFDNANRITGISDSSNSALTWTYGYDTLDRLTSGTTSAITDGWTYDANGSRLTQTGTTPITFSVSSTNNQLTATTGGLVRSYSYDAAGNTEGYGSYTFTYNNRGRMKSTSGSSTNYLYNALGQMIEKSGTLGTTIFMQDEAGHLLGEYDGSGNLMEETIRLGDIPVATLRPHTGGGIDIYYVHTDHLNAPRKVSQASTGTLAWRLDSDPFSTATPNQNPGGLGTFVYNLRFPGQYYDAETGLSQNWMRDYDPLTGKYIESDPIGLRGGSFSTYAYVNGNPISNYDRAGTFVWPWWVLGGGAAIAGAGGYIAGTIIYNAYASQIQDGIAAAGAAVTAPVSSPPAPPVARDPSFDDRGCPPDCQKWRWSLDRMYQALMVAEGQPNLSGSLDVQWQQFKNSKRMFEKECGPYMPPPTLDDLHDIYGK
jgi:RHS repeat-associated protein